MRKVVLTFLFSIFVILTFGQKYQIVNPDDFKINGKIKLFTSKADFLRQIGKAEKIVENFPGCGSYEEDASKGARFFIYTKNGIKYYVYNEKADFLEINLKDNPRNYINVGRHKISGKTSIKELKRMFPTAYDNYKKEEEAYLFRIKFNPQWDDEIQIVIKNEKVSEMYYWSPC